MMQNVMILTIASGVEFQVKDQSLTVNGDLTVSGHINMLEDNATITVIGRCRLGIRLRTYDNGEWCLYECLW